MCCPVAPVTVGPDSGGCEGHGRLRRSGERCRLPRVRSEGMHMITSSFPLRLVRSFARSFHPPSFLKCCTRPPSMQAACRWFRVAGLPRTSTPWSRYRTPRSPRSIHPMSTPQLQNACGFHLVTWYRYVCLPPHAFSYLSRFAGRNHRDRSDTSRSTWSAARSAAEYPDAPSLRLTIRLEYAILSPAKAPKLPSGGSSRAWECSR